MKWFKNNRDFVYKRLFICNFTHLQLKICYLWDRHYPIHPSLVFFDANLLCPKANLFKSVGYGGRMRGKL